jgi:hypothetical protein
MAKKQDRWFFPDARHVGGVSSFEIRWTPVCGQSDLWVYMGFPGGNLGMGWRSQVESQVGGCRPLQLTDFLNEERWQIDYHNVVTAFGIPSEIVVALKSVGER